MGASYSEPVPYQVEGSSFISFTIRTARKIRIQNAPQEVINSLSNEFGLDPLYRHGIVQFKFNDWLFVTNCGKSAATQGKLVVLGICKCMNRLGYNLIVSSDLARMQDQSTLFFHKSAVERSDTKFICVAPGGWDKFVLLRTDEQTRTCIKDAISTSWHRGIQDEDSYNVDGEDIYEIKCNGNPWNCSGEDSTSVRQLMLSIIGKLGELHWRIYASVNIKGGTDTLYFMYDENYRISPSDLMMVSMNRSNRLRLISGPEHLHHIVFNYISSKWEMKNEGERDYYGAHEFHLKGDPWCTEGVEAIDARDLVTQLLPVLQQNGMTLLYTLDISRSLTDKSVFIFCKTPPCIPMLYSCISLSSTNKIRFLGMPDYLKQCLIKDVVSHYEPGIEASYEREDAHCSCFEIRLNAYPWSSEMDCDTAALHARRMLLKIMESSAYCKWQVCASVDVSSKYYSGENNSYPIDVNSWILCSNNTNQMQHEELPPLYYPQYVGIHRTSEMSYDAPPSYEDVFQK